MFDKSVAAIAVAAIAAIGAGAHAQSNDVQSAVEALSVFKQEAEKGAEIAVKACPVPKECSFRFNYYRMFYGRARHSFDNVVHSIVMELEHGREIEGSAFMQQMIHDAAQQFDTMRLAYEKMKGHDIQDGTSPTHIEAGKAIKQHVAEITDDSVQIERQYRKSDKAGHKEIIGALHGLRWRGLEDFR